jgi:hypothetical protein
MGVLVLLGLAGCGSGDGSLSGLLEGRPWRFEAGQAHLNAAGSAYTVFMFAVSFTPCTTLPQESSVHVSGLPNAAGTYALSSQLSVTFSSNNNYTATSGGTVDVESISDTIIHGRADVSVNAGTYVNGTFAVPVCP